MTDDSYVLRSIVTRHRSKNKHMKLKTLNITISIWLLPGYSTFLGLDLEARRAVVVLTNTGFHNVDYLGFHLLDPTVPLP